MGKRRIRNLFFNGQRQIIGFDVRSDRIKEVKEKYGIKTVSDLKKVSSQDFDAMFISTPPDQHGDYIRMALKQKKHFFVEHPTSDDGYEDIFRDKNSNLVKAPSCTMRFYTPVKMIKDILEEGRIGKILAFQYHMGQYLPDWHPWEDYSQVYFSKKKTSACREMFPFELIWLSWLMNSAVAEVSGTISKISDLDMDADDIILAKVKYDSGIIGNVIVDAISRKPFRTLRILGSDGVLEWERSDFIIKIYDAKSKKSESITVLKGHSENDCVNEEEMYNDEIKAFLGAIDGKEKFPHTFADSRRLLKVLYALEKSSKTGRVISLKNYDDKKD
ncbi:MAG: Oxidoreductase domain protein [Candidatus Magasanikbacteria bacterium GW2011_GWC2_41_17]|uniref:Oxidoreductase domain protein n=2 Tax=Candidatus Magasanikiibacteriota TaxID=1752731 RepID=A0A0G0WLL3_9BACT|nr:MAG: Oxidoreductase domain protein [Candidatus Magasanikbacteria bacterium GW2011_GWC2_41_17]KKS13644.1 MAG: Oxidoreductase domain protein [Candidatus Magasanikbacteria bacterium GW2011_GWA2_41_55]